MKTKTLIELQKTITQGDWCINKKVKAIVETAKGGQGMAMIADCTDCDEDRPRAEDEANAQAISAVPKLIAELLKAREALERISYDMQGVINVAAVDDKSRLPSLIAIRNTSRTALENA